MSGGRLMAGGIACWALAAFEIRGGKILAVTAASTPTKSTMGRTTDAHAALNGLGDHAAVR